MNDSDPGMAVRESELPSWFQILAYEPKDNPRLLDTGGAQNALSTGPEKLITGGKYTGSQVRRKAGFSVTPRQTESRRVDSGSGRLGNESFLEGSQIIHGGKLHVTLRRRLRRR